MKVITNSILKTVRVTFTLLLICGFIYPILMTFLAQTFFPYQAKGSLITVNRKVIGSELIGQDFTENYFMKCRPSAVNYNTYTNEDMEKGNFMGVSSGSENFAASSPELIERVQKDIKEFLQKNPTIKKEDIPTDLMTASGSGLDPHISSKSALIQLESISKASGLTEEKLQKIVDKHTEKKALGIFGEESVNVLKFNLEVAQEMGLIDKIDL